MLLPSLLDRMKDQYFGDLNDYRKYGLLRLLGGPDGVSLGIAWMLTAPDGRRDGQRLAYLDQPERHRQFDPPLFDVLHAIVHRHRRRLIACAQEFGLFPGAAFFDAEFTDSARPREAVFTKLLHAFAERELIFFDPDNGLEVKSRPWGRKDSCKYLYWREVEAVFHRGHSVLIFQHFPRRDRRRYTAQLKHELAHHTGAANIFALQTSLVVFLLVAQPHHAARLRERARLVQARWREQMRLM